MAKGTVTLEEVILALKNLGGEARSRDIEDHIIYQQRDGNLPKTYQYGGWDSYRKTINQVLQTHTPSYRKFRGKEIFKKTGPSKFKLLDFEFSKYQAIESGVINTSKPRLPQTKEISNSEFKKLKVRAKKLVI